MEKGEGRSEERDGDKPGKGMGVMAVTMMALWLDPTAGPGHVADLPRRIGAGVLVAWTSIAIALGAALSALRLAFSGGEHNPLWFAVATPMFLPVVLGTVYLPRRRVPALALALVLGAVIGIGVALVLPTSLPVYWRVYLALSAGALVASATYGAVARA
jgi:hypothetical protein